MFTVIHDAVRLAERESRSALPGAPVVEERPRHGLTLTFGVRQVASASLRRLADVLEPAPRPLTEPRFTADPCGN